jgi:hypothetical protein
MIDENLQGTPIVLLHEQPSMQYFSLLHFGKGSQILRGCCSMREEDAILFCKPFQVPLSAPGW